MRAIFRKGFFRLTSEDASISRDSGKAGACRGTEITAGLWPKCIKEMKAP